MNCPNCGCWGPICRCNGDVFHTSKDKLWEFETSHLGKKVEIRSKGQWNKFMKKKGLVQLMDSDLKKMESRPNAKPNFKSTPRKEITKIMLESMQERRRISL